MFSIPLMLFQFEYIDPDNLNLHLTRAFDSLIHCFYWFEPLLTVKLLVPLVDSTHFKLFCISLRALFLFCIDYGSQNGPKTSFMLVVQIWFVDINSMELSWKIMSQPMCFFIVILIQRLLRQALKWQLWFPVHSFYKYMGKLGLSSTCLKFEPEIMLKVNLISKLISLLDIAFDINIAMVSVNCLNFNIRFGSILTSQSKDYFMQKYCFLSLSLRDGASGGCSPQNFC